MINRLLGIATLCAALGLAALLGVELGEGQRDLAPVEVRIEARVPTPAAAELLALGHNEALADLLWLSLLGFWFDNFQEDIHLPHDWLSPHLDAILALDPGFRMVYVWAGYLVHLSSDEREAAVLEANRYLRKGLQRFPDDWQLHYILAFNLLWELNPADPELRAAAREEGMRLLRRAASLPGGPEHLQGLIVSLEMRDAAWSRAVTDLPARFIVTRQANEARNLRGHMGANLGQAWSDAWAFHRSARVQGRQSADLAGMGPIGDALTLEHGLAAPLAPEQIPRLEEQR